MTITLNGTTGITTPDVTSDSGASLTSRVAKTGDTMTGNLEIQSSGGSQLKVHKTGVTTLGVHPAIDFQLTQTNTQSALLGQISGEFISGWGGDLILSTKPANSTPDNNVISRMRIDSAGRVTMPYQPAFRATSDNNSQSLTNNVTAVAVFDVAETNIGGHYNTANGKFTAPVSGFYSFASSLLITQGGAVRIDLMFYKNGSPWVSHEFKDYGAVSSNSSVTAAMHGYLSANDFVEIVVMIGGANGGIYQEPKFWNFSGFLVG